MPQGGKNPLGTSGIDHLAERPVTTRSQAVARTKPPPRAWPSTAAITGTGWAEIARTAAAVAASCATRPSRSSAASSRRSLPAQKPFPAPVRMTERMVLSSARAAR